MAIISLKKAEDWGKKKKKNGDFPKDWHPLINMLYIQCVCARVLITVDITSPQRKKENKYYVASQRSRKSLARFQQPFYFFH